MDEAAVTANLFDGRAAVIRRALNISPPNTAISSDDDHFRLLADLPDVALDQLGMLSKFPIHNLTLPIQVLVNLLCLLGKRIGGSRVIARMCSIYLCLMKANGTAIREWDVEHCHLYDSALAGCS